MLIDCHVHVSAFTPAHGKTSNKLLKSLPFRFMRWRLKLPGDGEALERQVEAKLLDTLGTTPELDAAVILAFDAVYSADGQIDDARTHLHVTNDYVIDLCRTHPKTLFGCSVNPYRPDAADELQRCIAAGAVLMKWLPIVQGFNPADPRCLPLFDILAHHNVPLLSHTGGERMLVRLNDEYAPPHLLKPALDRGVTVIAAHCGTRSALLEEDYFDEWVTMVRMYPNLYGDTAALNLPMRNHAFGELLKDDLLRSRLVHGSDWPVIAIPPLNRVGLGGAIRLMKEPNWLRRDIKIKRAMGFDDAYFHRAATLLRLPGGYAG